VSLYPERGLKKFRAPELLLENTAVQAPVVERLDNAIHRINRYPLALSVVKKAKC